MYPFQGQSFQVLIPRDDCSNATNINRYPAFFIVVYCDMVRINLIYILFRNWMAVHLDVTSDGYNEEQEKQSVAFLKTKLKIAKLDTKFTYKLYIKL